MQKRHRTGYSDGLGPTLRRQASVSDFVDCAEPGQFLADFDEIIGEDPRAGSEDRKLQQLYWAHGSTSGEVVSCCADLRVLNKGDFRTLLKWRLGLRDFRNELRKTQKAAVSGGDDDEGEEEDGDEGAAGGAARRVVGGGSGLGDDDGDLDALESEEGIMAELEARREKARMKVRREKKKQRAAQAKLRERKAYGMDHNSFEVAQDDAVFKLTSIKDKAHLNAASHVCLDGMDGAGLEVEDAGRRKRLDVEVDEYGSDLDDEERDQLLNEKVEGMLDESYMRYLGRRKEPELRGTKSHKRSKKLVRDKAMAVASEDATDGWDEGDAYAKLLTGSTGDGAESSDDEGDDDDDGFHTGPKSYKEAMQLEAAKKTKARAPPKLRDENEGKADDDDDDDDDGDKEEDLDSDDESGYAGRAAKRPKQAAQHPLLVTVAPPPEAPSAAASRWFSDSVFDDMLRGADGPVGKAVKGRAGKAARAAKAAAAQAEGGGGRGDDNDDDDEDERGLLGQDGMPLTDKQQRSLRRKKNEARVDRQKKRKDARLEKLPGLEFVGAAATDRKGRGGVAVGVLAGGEEDEAAELMGAGLEDLDEAARARTIAAREAIRAGVGSISGAAGGGKGKGAKGEAPIEFVPGSAMPARKDERTYGSDSEEYDSDDVATTLALGTLMLRKSRAKKLVDASYNRYAWNDPSDLPEWFADDEAKHYKPQLPIPKSLMDSIKQRFQDLTSKPIKKVAEARARKRKRSADKLKAAKKKAEALSNAPDMSEKEKLKAIGKAISSASKGAGSGKDYVPTKKLVIARKAFGGKAPPGSSGKSFKMVDKRLKNDLRAQKRVDKKKKKGGGRRKGKG